MCTSHFHRHPCSHLTPCLTANVLSHCPAVLARLRQYHDQPNQLPLQYPLPMPEVCSPSPHPNLSQQMGGRVDDNSQAVTQGQGNMFVWPVPWGCGREDYQLCRVGWGNLTCPWVSAKVGKASGGNGPHGQPGPPGPHEPHGPHGPHGPHELHGFHGFHGSHEPHGPHGSHVPHGPHRLHAFYGLHELHEPHGPNVSYGSYGSYPGAQTNPEAPTGPGARTNLSSTASVAGQVMNINAANEDKETIKASEMNDSGNDAEAKERTGDSIKMRAPEAEEAPKQSNELISSSEKKETKDKKNHADGHIDGAEKKPQCQQQSQTSHPEDFKKSKNRKRNRARNRNSGDSEAELEPSTSQGPEVNLDRKAQRKAKAVLNQQLQGRKPTPEPKTPNAKTIAKEKAVAAAQAEKQRERREKAEMEAKADPKFKELKIMIGQGQVYAGYIYQGQSCLLV